MLKCLGVTCRDAYIISQKREGEGHMHMEGGKVEGKPEKVNGECR